MQNLKTGSLEKYTPVRISREITIDHTKCGTADSTGFPMLVSIQDWKLRHYTQGGRVANLTNGYDIIFSSDFYGTSLLNWEIDKYDQVEGILVAWVKIPTLLVASNTVIYMSYGDSTITSFMGNTNGSAWDSSFRGVWHFGSSTSLNLTDSTTNAITGTGGGTTGQPTSGNGKINGGISFNRLNNQRVNVSNAALNFNGNVTVSFWVNPVSTIGAYQCCISMTNTTPAVGQRAYSVYLAPTLASRIYVAIGGGGSDTPGVVNMSASYTAGAWNHFVITADGTNHKVYLNGQLVFTQASTKVAVSTYTNGFFGNEATSFPLDGLLDEIRIASTARSQSWVTAEYNNQNSPSTFYSIGTENVVPTFCTWSTTNKSNYLTVSNSGLSIAGNTMGQYGMGIATVGKSHGKHYFEFLYTVNSITYEKIGLSTYIPGPADINAVGWVVNSIGYRGTPWCISHNSAQIGSGCTATTVNDVISMVVDLDNLLVYIYLNGVLATGTPRSIAAGTWYPAFSSDANLGAGTANFGASPFSYYDSITINGNSLATLGYNKGWFSIQENIEATGGTIVDSGGYRTHTFTTNGNFVVNKLPLHAKVECLVVAGGGGGGSIGGGGGGGVIYNKSYPITSTGSLSIVVGSGGTNTNNNFAKGGNGGDSSFDGLIAIGGGGGGCYSATLQHGANGGSGGGGGASSNSPYTAGNGGSATVNQGSAGGTGATNGFNGGGGGGATAVGGNASGTTQGTAVGGTGGAGLTSNISGSSVVYGSGGGGAGYNTRGLGGTNAGNGVQISGGFNATSPIANTGSGGGGGYGAAAASTAGASGIVIIRYPYDLSQTPIDQTLVTSGSGYSLSAPYYQASTNSMNTLGSSVIFVLLIVSSSGVAGTLSDNYGNTYIVDKTNTNVTYSVSAVLYRCSNPIVGSNHIISFVGPSSANYYPTLHVAAMKNIVNYNPLDQSTTNTGSGTPATTGQITALFDKELILGGIGYQGANITSILNGYTNVSQYSGSGNYYPSILAYKLQKAKTSENLSAVSTSTLGWVSLIASYKKGVEINLPSITGALTTATGNVNILNNNVPNGTWASSNSSIITIDPNTGSSTAIAPGTAKISYTVSSGCSTATPITVVNPFALVTTTSVSSTTTITAVSPTINITGATVGVVVVTDYQVGAIGNVTDSSGNTWTLAKSQNDGATTRVSIYYVINPITSASYSVTYGGGGTTYPSMYCVFFSGGPTNPILRQINGKSTSAASTSMTSGNIVLENSGAIVVAGINAWSSSTLPTQSTLTTIGANTYAVGVRFAGLGAYEIQSTMVNRDVTFNYSSTNLASAAIISIY